MPTASLLGATFDPTEPCQQARKDSLRMWFESVDLDGIEHRVARKIRIDELDARGTGGCSSLQGMLVWLGGVQHPEASGLGFQSAHGRLPHTSASLQHLLQ